MRVRASVAISAAAVAALGAANLSRPAVADDAMRTASAFVSDVAAVPAVAKKRSRRPAHRVAVIRAGVTLARRPGGRAAVRVSTRTDFGSRRVLNVAAQRGDWLGLVTSERPNNRLAWARGDERALQVHGMRLSLHADLSARTLTLRRGKRRVRKLSVAIGRPGSETPTGRFAVTDKLSGGRFGSYYGCCILALNGHQPSLPPGWTGGNRLAIHGTSAPATIGAAASAGCLRAGDADLRVLMARVPLGTPVFIHR